MNTISGVTINHSTLLASRELHAETASSTQLSLAENNATNRPAVESVKVSLSVEGLQASASASGASGSSASQQAREIEKIRQRIKEVQEQIQEQQAQLQAIASDKKLSSEQKTQRMNEINQQLGSLNSSLASASAQLMQALKGTPKTGGADDVQALPYVHQDSSTSTTPS